MCQRKQSNLTSKPETQYSFQLHILLSHTKDIPIEQHVFIDSWSFTSQTWTKISANWQKKTLDIERLCKSRKDVFKAR